MLYTSSTRICFVTVRVRDMVIVPNNTEFMVDEVINCTAQGRPDPTISWNALQSGGVSTLTQIHSHVSNLVRCTFCKQY